MKQESIWKLTPRDRDIAQIVKTPGMKGFRIIKKSGESVYIENSTTERAQSIADFFQCPVMIIGKERGL